MMATFKEDPTTYAKRNLVRLLKLYLNYWIIIAIFILGVGWFFGQTSRYPGNIQIFLLNFTGISTSYSGAWWFLTTYVILIFASPFINRLVIDNEVKYTVTLSFILYFLAYIQRIKGVIIFDDIFMNWLMRQISLVGTSQFPFIIGGVLADRQMYSRIHSVFERIKMKNLLATSLIVAMILFHSFVETLFIAPFNGIVFVCLFNLMDKPKRLNRLMDYFSIHSTNIWLTHMFFYAIFFQTIVFYPKYPIFIFPWLLLLCLVASHTILLLYRLSLNIMKGTSRKVAEIYMIKL